MLSVEMARTFHKSTDIPELTADEVYSLLTTEFRRFMSLVESLDADDWSRPTACTAWTVRDMLAHQAGGYASGAGYMELIRQYTARPKPGQLPEDAINDLQLNERAAKSPAELIAELRKVGPLAMQKWAYQFRFARLLT